MNSRKTFRSPILVTAAVACVLAGTAALAGERGDATASMAVRYDAAQISSPLGASDLYARIRSAARLVCGDSGRTLNEQRIWRSCYRGAVEAAVADVHSPLLQTMQEQPVSAMLVR